MSVRRRGVRRLSLALILAFFIILPGCNEKRSNPPAFPETYLTATPHDPANVNFAIFAFTCDLGNCQFQCSLDGSGWSGCTSGQAYENLAEGTHTFEVRAVQHGKKDPTPASFTWTIDLTPPDTILTKTPPSLTNSPNADFEFECNSISCRFQCQMDSTGWFDCSSPKSYTGLSDGSHLFEVRAIDPAGNIDPTPASFNWTIDTIPPDTTITSSPNNPTNSSFAAFAFTCSESPATFECNLDNAGWSSCTSPKDYPDSWKATTTINAPLGTADHTAIWTGSEMIVWGGLNYLSSGARYNPATDSWTPTASGINGRSFHTAIWTGTEMIIWGGEEVLGFTNSGGRYNPATNSWVQIPGLHNPTVPGPRVSHTAIWTGTEMIIWGGACVNDINTGGRYNPSSNSWIATSVTNAPSAREGHAAVWTGSEMIVWGGSLQDRTETTGTSTLAFYNSGGRYNPATDTWTSTSAINAPSERSNHTALWTGKEMIVWGGKNSSDNGLNTGGKYDPLTDSWLETSISTAPPARTNHLAVWTGNSMIVWGGYFYDGSYHYPTNGGIYDPQNDAWSETPLRTVPSGRSNSAAVWTGSQMILWGGATSSDGMHTYPLDTGGILGLARGSHAFQVRCTDQAGNVDPTPASYTWSITLDSWTSTSTTNAPDGRAWHTAVWTGTEMIVWGGLAPSGGHLATGGKYNPSTDSWAPTSTTNAPDARDEHTAVWTGTEMIVWGGLATGGGSYLATGGKYNPSTDSWTATSTANAPDARGDHTAIWSRTEMIIWGGVKIGGDFASGSKYNPYTDSWIATSISNAPDARYDHTVVWTGTEMIVWGGSGRGGPLATGGKYNPSTDSWTATSIANAPLARDVHTAVWTGTEMIIWGGVNYNNGGFLGTGGKYNPSTDSWTATSTANAPDARNNHTAVWTGTEMVIWGGYNYSHGLLATGGKYNPSTDSWTATSTINAPYARVWHTAVWTGTEMIIWGGETIYGELATGGRYIP